MGKNECKLNCSQAGSNRRQLLLSQVTCFIYKDMWATMLLSEREEKRKERVVAAAAAWGGITRAGIKRKLMRASQRQFKNVPAFKYANEQEADTWVDNSV